MAYSPVAIANYFISRAAREGAPLSHMKLQKLVYFAEGWHLAFKDQQLIDDRIEAWPYGPVIKSLYHQFKSYRNANIREPETIIEANGGRIKVDIPNIPNGDTFTLGLLNKIWEIYGNFSAIDLSTMTHQDGTPWHKTYKERGGGGSQAEEIPRALIGDYFKALRQGNLAKSHG